MLLKTLSFTLVLLLGVFFRKRGCLPAKTRDTLTQIIVCITLPATIVTGVSVESFRLSYLWIILCGLALNVLAIGVGFVISRGMPDRDRITSCLAMTGYSIGSFTLPFTQQFLPEDLLAIVCLFDLGNAFMTMGGTKLLVNRLFGSGQEKSGAGFLRDLLSSPSLVAELIMVALLLCGYRMPAPIRTVAAPIANANYFLSIFLVGGLLRLDITREQLRMTGRFLVTRCLFVVLFAGLLYVMLPYDRQTVLTVVLASCSPIAIMSVIYAEQCHGDAGIVGLTSSVSVFISIVMMFCVLALY